ncbi:phosphatidylinositol 4,5-bisphosphate 3-kinase catalytic subunit alpha isoform-like isoform X2 [Mya arenaria]|uniref:phosphatidylinositol 4,5-bisphosphate 3-kinase catalytic subunit alpha isoform-like isoform X2 n=1 Tax=Mya arenaria TaxID=6604 RepID=UPI0022E00382|nr:phosphatidylinositol 4,5-bisphosphate 3-kinase catalytic subunit alpha isoform-like isoform X2 [Mya arenaria]XP_052760741.1 phosphatidylinositol 4,5-bisphosphate 3-kinase catalytic subunit alpha isoform-like isoform X2 [Mya arenaria]
MPPSSGELWGHHLMPQQVAVDCLLPNGLLIPLRCNRDSTIEKVKADLWLEARRQPLFHKLGEQVQYIFVGITQDAELEEFYDETRRLCDLKLFQPILKVIEPKGNREEKMLNYELGMAIGIPMNEFNEMKELEVMTFRRNILTVCQNAVEDRRRNGKHSLALYTYPPDVENSAKLPSHLEEKLQTDNKNFLMCVWVVQSDKSRNKFTLRIPHTAKPNDVIAETIRWRSRKMGRSKEETDRCIDGYSHTYVLKVCGCDLFLFEGYPISQYKYIRECLETKKIPQLMLLTKENVYATIKDTPFHMPSYVQRGIQALNDVQNKTTISMFEVHTNFKMKVHCATYVNVKDVGGKIYVKVGLYHGTEPLCESKLTKESDFNNPRWNEWLEFLYLSDIPRSAKICFSICSVSKRKNKKIHYALAWGNLQLFDFNTHMLSDKVSLQLWPMPHGLDELLNPLGIPGSNPDKDQPTLEIEFETFSPTLSSPPDTQLEDLAKFATNRDNRQSSLALQADDWRHEEEQLLDIIGKDPLSEILEQEKALLWKRRDYCLHQPNSLPKLLSAIKWNDRENVAQLYMLLKQWPTVSPEVALHLLDCSFTDLRVRQFAVHCLEIGISDDKLQRYLLQFIQALKFEPYLDNPLTRFLLKRSLMNQRIGQQFFWHLKSELHHTAMRTRYGLILEAFCRGCGSFMKTLLKQVEALDKLTKLTNVLKASGSNDKTELMKGLHEQLQQPDYQEALTSLASPLNNSHRLGNLCYEVCEVKMSKKKPLWMVWENNDPLADLWIKQYTILFKNGDDLRQDMLTLQLISVMDSIWKTAGLDLRMTPYLCLASGQDVGLIEGVRNSATIMKIQEKGGAKATLQLGSKALHNWIRLHNLERYDEAIDMFTRSCVGYCIATFVLGIGDRHSENIMCIEDGRVFHIDFGHFLNHKKKKFGINRERVPFVLTEDFVYVIARGRDQPQKSEEFKEFQQLCLQAYKELRKQADLIINLLTMMLSCGIPELQSLDDISYVRKTLAVESTEEEAELYFRQQFEAAYKGQWTTKVDWIFHHLKN